MGAVNPTHTLVFNENSSTTGSGRNSTSVKLLEIFIILDRDVDYRFLSV